jgi:hypothetical protein
MRNYKKNILLLLLATVISSAILAKANQKAPCPTSGNFASVMFASVNGGAK